MKSVILVLSAVMLTCSMALAKKATSVEKPVIVSVKFKSAAHAEHYMTYMSEQGEQDMYTWMEEAEPELAKMPAYDNTNFVIDYAGE